VPVVSTSVFSIREDILQVLLQVAFLAAVPGAWSFVTLGSIGVSGFSFLFAWFAKLNLRSSIDADAGGAGPAGSSKRNAGNADEDGEGSVASSRDVEMTIAKSDKDIGESDL